MEAYSRYGERLVRKAERLLQSQDDAQDIVHGLFVDLLAKKKTSVDLAYLYRAVTNRCLNHLRDRKGRLGLIERHDESLRGIARIGCADSVIGMDLLTKLVDKLDKKSAEVLPYHYFDDMTQDEIAELMSTSRRSVARRITRIQECAQQLTTEPLTTEPKEAAQ